ncbi:hypothetical protein GDO81_026262 [Engystomops pustulosus]|uniref:Uncharacterized protein n=1 Tax=Engystomops pustulosus TaxID=76066 RepID=A0AAV6YZF6_ENGPU|nr:hypothetical protein GDO81_026262 [Engystomops pustulosus]
MTPGIKRPSYGVGGHCLVLSAGHPWSSRPVTHLHDFPNCLRCNPLLLRCSAHSRSSRPQAGDERNHNPEHRSRT